MPLLKFMVRPARLELARVLPHSDLNAARLPIPPRPHAPTLFGSLAMKVPVANRRLQENSSVKNI